MEEKKICGKSSELAGFNSGGAYREPQTHLSRTIKIWKTEKVAKDRPEIEKVARAVSQQS